MKNHLILIALILGFAFQVGCQKNSQTSGSGTEEKKSENAEVKQDSLPLTSIQFETPEHDFGKIKEGEKVSHTFKFKNTGTNPLVLSSVKPSCGCTVPNWSKDPIAPGQDGVIEVTFDSEGRQGTQHKSITVMANTDPKVTVLKFTAEVLKK